MVLLQISDQFELFFCSLFRRKSSEIKRFWPGKIQKSGFSFPFSSERVKAAYISPDVDNSTEKFSWAIPNFVAIRDFATEKFGWTGGKIDEIIKPVIKKMSVKSSQERIDNFFLTSRITLPEKGSYQSSKRVKEAIGRVLGQTVEPKPKPKAKRKVTEDSNNVEPKVTKKTESKVQPPKDWKKEDELKKQGAKKKALEVMKRQAALVSKKKTKTKAGRQVSRKVLPQANLSSESDDSDIDMHVK